MDKIFILMLVFAGTGVLFFLAGLLLKNKPPKNINWYYGYRTPGAMKSQKRWDFAQRYSARELMRSGAALLTLSLITVFLCQFITVTDQQADMIGLGFASLLIGVIAISIVRTEMALTRLFPE